MMKLSYVVDEDGNRTAVIIPIAAWNALLLKYPDLLEMINSKPVDGSE